MLIDLKLSVSSDLSEEAYLEASELLKAAGDLPLVLVYADECPLLEKWLWEHHRVTSCLKVSQQLVGYKWSLQGHKYVVTSGF